MSQTKAPSPTLNLTTPARSTVGTEMLCTPANLSPEPSQGDPKKRKLSPTQRAGYFDDNDESDMEILEAMKQLTGELRSLKVDFETEKNSNAKEFDELKKAIQFRDEEIEVLKKTNAELAKGVTEVEKRAIIVEAMSVRSTGKSVKLHEKMLELESKQMKDELIVFGMPEVSGTPTESLSDAISRFFSDKMLVNGVLLKKCHRIGVRRDAAKRPIIVQLANELDKGRILKHGIKLKGSIFAVAEHLPREYEERRKRLRDTFKDAKAKNAAVHWVNDKLHVDKKVVSVKVDEVKDLNQDVMAEAISKKVKRAPPMKSGSCTLDASTVAVSKWSEVVPSLNAVLADGNASNARAKSLVYAYRIQKDGSLEEHYEDDEDYGAGRRLLQLLRENKVTNQLVCVARHGGLPAFGQAGFDKRAEAVRSVLGLH